MFVKFFKLNGLINRPARISIKYFGFYLIGHARRSIGMSQKIPDTFPLHGRNIFGCIFHAFHYRNQTQKQEKRKDDKVDTENHFTTYYYQGLSLCLYQGLFVK